MCSLEAWRPPRAELLPGRVAYHHRGPHHSRSPPASRGAVPPGRGCQLPVERRCRRAHRLCVCVHICRRPCPSVCLCHPCRASPCASCTVPAVRTGGPTRTHGCVCLGGLTSCHSSTGSGISPWWGGGMSPSLVLCVPSRCAVLPAKPAPGIPMFAPVCWVSLFFPHFLADSHWWLPLETHWMGKSLFPDIPWFEQKTNQAKKKKKSKIPILALSVWNSWC